MENVTRRDFVKKTAIATAAMTSVSSFNILGAAKNKTVKLGDIGCGGRSTGAVKNHIEAANNKIRFKKPAGNWEMDDQRAAERWWFES